MHTTARLRVPMSDETARALGHYRGYNAANYAANVSGEDLDTLTPDSRRSQRLTARERMFYDDGFSAGIDAFKLDDMELDWSDDGDDVSDDSAHSPAFVA
jgi:hypothetical protein